MQQYRSGYRNRHEKSGPDSFFVKLNICLVLVILALVASGLDLSSLDKAKEVISQRAGQALEGFDLQAFQGNKESVIIDEEILSRIENEKNIYLHNSTKES